MFPKQNATNQLMLPKRASDRAIHKRPTIDSVNMRHSMHYLLLILLLLVITNY